MSCLKLLTFWKHIWNGFFYGLQHSDQLSLTQSSAGTPPAKTKRSSSCSAWFNLPLTFFILMVTKWDFDWRAKCLSVQVKKKKMLSIHTLCCSPKMSQQYYAYAEKNPHLFSSARVMVVWEETRSVYVTFSRVKAWMDGSQTEREGRKTKKRRNRCANLAARRWKRFLYFSLCLWCPDKLLWGSQVNPEGVRLALRFQIKIRGNKWHLLGFDHGCETVMQQENVTPSSVKSCFCLLGLIKKGLCSSC